MVCPKREHFLHYKIRSLETMRARIGANKKSTKMALVLLLPCLGSGTKLVNVFSVYVASRTVVHKSNVAQRAQFFIYDYIAWKVIVIHSKVQCSFNNHAKRSTYLEKWFFCNVHQLLSKRRKLQTFPDANILRNNGRTDL